MTLAVLARDAAASVFRFHREAVERMARGDEERDEALRRRAEKAAAVARRERARGADTDGRSARPRGERRDGRDGRVTVSDECREGRRPMSRKNVDFVVEEKTSAQRFLQFLTDGYAIEPRLLVRLVSVALVSSMLSPSS